MRKIQHLILTFAILLLLTGCTSFQAKEAGRAVAGGLFEMVLDVATDGPERRLENRRRWEDNPANRWDSCLPPCEITTDSGDLRLAAEREEDARRKLEREKRHYEEEVNSIMDALEEAERRSSQLEPESATTGFRQEEDGRPHRREKALEHQAEFAAFMEDLEAAEQQSGDPLSATTTDK